MKSLNNTEKVTFVIEIPKQVIEVEKEVLKGLPLSQDDIDNFVSYILKTVPVQFNAHIKDKSK